MVELCNPRTFRDRGVLATPKAWSPAEPKRKRRRSAECTLFMPCGGTRMRNVSRRLKQQHLPPHSTHVQELPRNDKRTRLPTAHTCKNHDATTTAPAHPLHTRARNTTPKQSHKASGQHQTTGSQRDRLPSTKLHRNCGRTDRGERLQQGATQRTQEPSTKGVSCKPHERTAQTPKHRRRTPQTTCETQRELMPPAKDPHLLSSLSCLQCVRVGTEKHTGIATCWCRPRCIKTTKEFLESCIKFADPEHPETLKKQITRFRQEFQNRPVAGQLGRGLYCECVSGSAISASGPRCSGSQ